MNQPGPGLKGLLDEIGDFDTPTASDMRRVHSRLAGKLAAGALGGAATTTAASKSMASTLSAWATLPAAVKGGVAVSVVAGSWATGAALVSSEQAAAPRPSVFVSPATQSPGASGAGTIGREVVVAERAESAELREPQALEEATALSQPTAAEHATSESVGTLLQGVPEVPSRKTATQFRRQAAPNLDSTAPLSKNSARVEQRLPKESAPKLAQEAGYLLTVRGALSRGEAAEAEAGLAQYFAEFPAGTLRGEALALKQQVRRLVPKSGLKRHDSDSDNHKVQ